MADKIIKPEVNHVIIEKIIATPDRIETEEFDQERLDNEKIRAQAAKKKAEARILQLEEVQIKMEQVL